MIHEQRINQELGDCNYHLIAEFSVYKLWERECGNNDIDFVIGCKWTKQVTPTHVDFDLTKRSNFALRFTDKNDAVIYYENMTKTKVDDKKIN